MPGAASAPGRATPFAVVRGDTVITDVSVLPMSSDAVLAQHTVVIRGDRIAAVAPSEAVAVPGGVTVIDGAGKWVMPGLADMHVHIWQDDELTMFLAAGVTTIRNMWGVEQHVAWRSEIARGERLGPTIVTAGSLIDGDPPDWPGSVVITAPGDADKLVAEQIATGYDFLKPVSRLTREAYDALAAAGKRHGVGLSGHVPIAVGLEGVLAARQHGIEHLDGYWAALVPREVPLPSVDDVRNWLRTVVSNLDPSRLPGLVEQTIAAGAWNCPTLIGYDRTPEMHGVAELERSVRWLDLAPIAMRARWARDFQAQSFTADDAAIVRRLGVQAGRIVAALVAAGAPILVGTDTGIPFVVPGESLHDEIELIVAAGVPRPRVLRAATADAWRYLGQPREAGIVEVGARADVLLLASDPRTAPLPLIPEGVMVRGRWLPRSELEARLAEIARRSARPDDRWTGPPPLALDGKRVHQARYDAAIAGKPVGREHVEVGVAGGKRTIAGQIADFGRRDTSYKLGPDGATIRTTYHTMTLEISGKIAAGELVVTGRDLAGRPVSLRAPVPAGAFLSAPGIGGAVQLVATLAAMKPGAKRTVTAVEMIDFPAIAIAPVRYDVERKPDAGGHRVFAVTATRGGAALAGQLVVDGAGLVVTQTLGPPVATTLTRAPE